MCRIDVFKVCYPIVISCASYTIWIKVVSGGNNELRIEFFCRLSHLDSNFFLIVLSIAAPVAKHDKIQGLVRNYLVLFFIIKRSRIALGKSGKTKEQKSQNYY